MVVIATKRLYFTYHYFKPFHLLIDGSGMILMWSSWLNLIGWSKFNILTLFEKFTHRLCCSCDISFSSSWSTFCTLCSLSTIEHLRCSIGPYKAKNDKNFINESLWPACTSNTSLGCLTNNYNILEWCY